MRVELSDHIFEALKPRVDSLRGFEWAVQEVDLGSNAGMCPACFAGPMPVGPDEIRERYSNNGAAFARH